MLYRFAAFVLDENLRELRLADREITVQPRVFDLLAFLLQNQERVVAKDEILHVLWPDAIVSEGSLQRVVSLARAALRQGDAAGMIRTYHGRGYRFINTEGDPDTSVETPAPAELVTARAALQSRAWAQAVAGFAAADQGTALAAADLERWAAACQCAGRPDEAVPLWERALACRVEAADQLGAARATLQLARIQFERREFAVARGWHGQARRHLAGREESREQGNWEWLAARFALVDGDLPAAVACGRRAQELGRSLGDPDVECLGMLYRGHGLLAQGDSREGLRLHDEAAAAVLAGGVTSQVGALIYCGVIWACRNRADWRRAAEWTEQFTRWCSTHQMSSYPGTCGLHRAEILNVSGQLDEAERAVLASCEKLAVAAPWAEGDAYRVLGDVHLARGDLDNAERAYGRAHELGWDPQPGLALLQVARGQDKVAAGGLERSLTDPDWDIGQRREMLLAHLAVVRAAAGNPGAAEDSLAELEQCLASPHTSAVDAVADWARAEVARARDHDDAAITYLRRAIRTWRTVGSPPNEAAMRVRLARVLRARADHEGAQIELAAANRIFRDLGATARLQDSGC